MYIWNIYNMCACTEIELNFDRLFQAENILVNEITGHSFYEGEISLFHHTLSILTIVQLLLHC